MLDSDLDDRLEIILGEEVFRVINVSSQYHSLQLHGLGVYHIEVCCSIQALD
jgi:hypothetical protein